VSSFPRLSPKFLVLGGMAAVLLIGFGGVNAYLPGGGDNASYIGVAESWLKYGRPLKIYDIDAAPYVLAPPLFPLLIAGVEAIIGRCVISMKGVLICSAALAVLSAFWALKRGLEDRRSQPGDSTEPSSFTPAMIAFCFALTPTLTACTHDILSDVPFTVLALVAVALTGEFIKSTRWKSLGLLILTLLLATGFRYAGMLLVASCGGCVLLEAYVQRSSDYSNRRRLIIAGVALTVTSALLLVWILARFGETPWSFLQGAMFSGAGKASSETFGTSHLAGETFLHRMGRIASFYALYQTNEIAGFEGFAPWYLIFALTPLPVFGWVVLMRRGQRLIPVFWLIYQIGLLCFQFAESRYYLPLLPLYLALFWTGGKTLFDWMCEMESPGKWSRPAVLTFALALFPAVTLFGSFFSSGSLEPPVSTYFDWLFGAALALVGVVWAVQKRPDWRARLVRVGVAFFLSAGCMRSVCENVVRERLSGPAPIGAGWSDLHAAALWLKDHAGADDTVASAKGSLVWFWSGRRSVPISQVADREKAFADIGRADWAVLDALEEDRLAARFLAPALEADAAHWQLAWSQGDTRVFKHVR